jgi:hypothetical protein
MKAHGHNNLSMSGASITPMWIQRPITGQWRPIPIFDEVNENGADLLKTRHHVVEYPGAGLGHSPSRYRLAFPRTYNYGWILGEPEMGAAGS